MGDNMPETPRRQIFDKVKTVLSNLKRKIPRLTNTRNPKIHKDLGILVKKIIEYEQKNVATNHHKFVSVGMDLFAIKNILEQIYKKNLPIEIDLQNISFDIPTKKGNIRIQFTKFIKGILEGKIDIRYLYNENISNTIGILAATLKILETQPQTVHLGFQQVFNRVREKYALVEQLSKMKEQNNLDEQYVLCHNYLARYPGLTGDLKALDYFFRKADINTKKRMISQIKQILGQPQLIHSGTIKEILKACYNKKPEKSELSETIIPFTDEAKTQIINLRTEIVTQIENLANNYPELKTQITSITNYLTKNYTPNQIFELGLLFAKAREIKQTNTFVALLQTYYKDPKTLIAKLQSIFQKTNP